MWALKRIRQTTSRYPRQYWLLFWGLLVNAAGGSIAWPFITIHMRQQLDVPLTTITLLFTINSAAGLAATSAGGPLVDRFGRKGAMVLALVVSGATLAAMSGARTLGVWALLQGLSGAANPLFRVGSNAMVADLVEPQRRSAAYALLRTVNNLGVAIGPSIGGFVTSVSYSLAFYLAAGATVLFALLTLSLLAETAPAADHPSSRPRTGGGYRPLLRDHRFLAFCGVYTLAGMPYCLMMLLLPVYAKEAFGLPESRYGLIMATNAAMVVLLQYTVTRVAERHRHLLVMAAGALFYAAGAGSVGWGWNFPTFLLSMIILTIGEMIMIPTSTALTANLAPPDMRGRYMSIYGLAWAVAFGIGPVIGGFLNDNLDPVATWYGGLAMGLAAAVGFWLLEQSRQATARRSKGNGVGPSGD
jgi:MFS family permease